jgi:hypothetical protein
VFVLFPLNDSFKDLSSFCVSGSAKNGTVTVTVSVVA